MSSQIVVPCEMSRRLYSFYNSSRCCEGTGKQWTKLVSMEIAVHTVESFLSSKNARIDYNRAVNAYYFNGLK